MFRADTDVAARHPAYLLFTLSIAAILLSGCGGGGGGGSDSAPPPANSAPRLTGNLTPSFPENADVSFFLNVTDADGDTVTITVGTSSDGQYFTLDTSSGEIRSTQPFDFEDPLDANGDNVYVQTVTLSDGKTTVTQEVRVTITNVDEAPSCDVLADVSIDENATGQAAVFSGTDPDAGDEVSAVFENLFFSDSRLDGLLALDAATGVLSVTTGLDAEAFEPGFTFTAFADYRTNGLFDRCSVNIALIDIPTRVTSGILFDTNLKNAQTVSDLDGRGLAEFWIPDAPESSGSGPIEGSLIFGEALVDAIADDGAATLSVAALGDTQRLRIRLTVSIGFGNAVSATVRSISDMDNDGIADLLVMANEPPNDGLDPTRRPWGYVIYAATIARSSGLLDLNSLSAGQGFSLTGPADFNGGPAYYVVANLDGVAGDEIAISLPSAISPDSETGVIYVIDGGTLAGTTDNLDFDLDASTRVYDGLFEPDALPVIGELGVIDDLDGDAIAELMMRSEQAVAVFPSANLVASTGGPIDSLNPLLLDLEGDRAGELSVADIDGDALSDLLIVRGDGSPDSKQVTIISGDALAPVLNSDSVLAVNSTNFAAGDYVDITSGGSGDGPEPVRATKIGDLDGDGRDEVAFSFLQDENFTPGVVYIFRGSALAGLSVPSFDFDNFTAEQGVKITAVPRQFTSLSTKIALTPDVDGDGAADLYLTSNLRLADDPPGRAIILKSSDVSSALVANESSIDIEALFFNEAP